MPLFAPRHSIQISSKPRCTDPGLTTCPRRQSPLFIIRLDCGNPTSDTTRLRCPGNTLVLNCSNSHETPRPQLARPTKEVTAVPPPNRHGPLMPPAQTTARRTRCRNSERNCYNTAPARPFHYPLLCGILQPRRLRPPARSQRAARLLPKHHQNQFSATNCVPKRNSRHSSDREARIVVSVKTVLLRAFLTSTCSLSSPPTGVIHGGREPDQQTQIHCRIPGKSSWMKRGTDVNMPHFTLPLLAQRPPLRTAN